MSLFNLERFVPEELFSQGPPCPTAPQNCGPPKVKVFGGDGIGAIVNAIISPNSNSVIGFDIVDPGKGFLSPPYVELVDECGNGRGASASALIGPLDGRNGNPTVLNPDTNEPEIGVVNIVVDAPGDGYIPGPNGSLGGNERVWAQPNEGYIVDTDGNYFVIPEGVNPPDNTDVYFPPRVTPGTDTGVTPGTDQDFPQTDPQYPVILEIGDVIISDPGLGYQPGDTISITPDNGAVLEPTIEGGSVTKVTIKEPGMGFNDLPTIEVVSATGYNAEFKPIFNIVDPESLDQIPDPGQIIQVIDCVGKF